ncbi:threonylcarbamoyl-AMP synthase [Candidatus Woesearchaeota archaeon ex4484_78]|nr:MAG: threonylcarbamoyl-AMP synthase [Candidatus Woesearchaeota archaeon ex4484_78]
MRVLSKEEAAIERRQLYKKLKEGAIFIYPTDTIYGIGCDATNPKAVKKIRELKERYTKPFSIIAPDINWIKENCKISTEGEKWLIKLPGPYTLVLPLKKTNSIAAETNSGLNTIGVRMPDHWITNMVKGYGKPIITTSVNKTGELFATKLTELQEFGADFIIFEGEKKNRPSIIIDLTKGEKIKKR